MIILSILISWAFWSAIYYGFHQNLGILHAIFWEGLIITGWVSLGAIFIGLIIIVIVTTIKYYYDRD